ncbi:MAG: hypothetical protein AB7R90_17745 [Reyranellaceae bacterium]
MKRLLVLLPAVAMLAACNGDLKVLSCADAACKPGTVSELPGLPVRLPEPHIALGYLMQHTNKDVAVCAPVPTMQSLSLPSRNVVYIRPETAIFAKTSFSAEFSADGALTKISFNSEPAGAENVKAVTELAKTVAGLVGLGAAGVKSVAPELEPKVPCNAGPVVLKYAPLQDVLDGKVAHPPL